VSEWAQFRFSAIYSYMRQFDYVDMVCEGCIGPGEAKHKYRPHKLD